MPQNVSPFWILYVSLAFFFKLNAFAIPSALPAARAFKKAFF